VSLIAKDRTAFDGTDTDKCLLVHQLSSPERRVLGGLARTRCEEKDDEDTWAHDGGTPAERNYNVHLAGMAGEWIVGLHFGGFVDIIPHGRRGDRHAPDVLVGDQRIGVKTATYWPPILKITDEIECEAVDRLALCYFNDPTIIIAGVIDIDAFWRHCYRKSFGHGLRYCYDFF
jgi:hypothetical protein